MRVLVTGATGFIGRHLLAELHGRHEVIALSRGTPPDELAGVAEWVLHDLSQPLVTRALPSRIDGIVHLAQSARYKDFPDGAHDVYAVNVHSTFQLLDWGRRAGADAFVFASTGGVYRYAERPVREVDPIASGGFYFRSKIVAEMLVDSFSEVLRPVVLRPFFVYGADQRRMLIPTLLDHIIDGQEIVVEGDPGLRINPIYVDDAVRVFEPALTGSASGVFNVAGPDAIAISELARLLGDALKVEPALRYGPAPSEGDLVGATDRMRMELGVVPRVGIRTGVERVVSAALAARA